MRPRLFKKVANFIEPFLDHEEEAACEKTAVTYGDAIPIDNLRLAGPAMAMS